MIEHTPIAVYAARRFNLDMPFGRAYPWREYVITTDTGDGVFLYRASDVLETIQSLQEEEGDGRIDYNDFCQEISPVESRKLARQIADETDWYICRAGTCARIIND